MASFTTHVTDDFNQICLRERIPKKQTNKQEDQGTLSRSPEKHV